VRLFMRDSGILEAPRKGQDKEPLCRLQFCYEFCGKFRVGAVG
jgi:hypothetical protein